MKLHQLPVLLSLAASCLFGATAQAQTFPSQTLTILVPAPAGGPPDIGADEVP